jgi:hypothetical protein
MTRSCFHLGLVLVRTTSTHHCCAVGWLVVYIVLVMYVAAVINAWSRSDDAQKIHRASAIVRDMIRQYESGDITLKPDVYVYSTLIKTCAHHRNGTKEENAQALDVALNAMATLEYTDYGPPNEVTYSAIMTAIYRLSDSSNRQDSLFETVFRRCAARGLVSKDVISLFHRGASPRLFRRLMGDPNLLQPRWSRNVPANKQPEQLQQQ